jgi:hypothetical protein
MALWENTVEVVGDSVAGVGKIALGVGALIVAPVALPVLRPVTKELVKGGLGLTRKMRSLLAEVGEQWSDLVAEARTDLERPTTERAETSMADDMTREVPIVTNEGGNGRVTEAEGAEKSGRRKRA